MPNIGSPCSGRNSSGLGVVGDWDHPYTTMSYPAEAQIAREIFKFVASGLLYRGSKPVMWSVVEKTALAEAEVEYEDHVSDTIFVAFPVVAYDGLPYNAEEDSDEPFLLQDELLKGVSVLIWTTTPWTIPGNRAIAFSSRVDYGMYRGRSNSPKRELDQAVGGPGHPRGYARK